MPTCTEAEREFLDVVADPSKLEGRNIYEMRASLEIARLPPELRELVVDRWERKIAAGLAFDAAFEKLSEIVRGDNTKAFEAFYKALSKEAHERAGVAE